MAQISTINPPKSMIKPLIVIIQLKVFVTIGGGVKRSSKNLNTATSFFSELSAAFVITNGFSAAFVITKIVTSTITSFMIFFYVEHTVRIFWEV